MEDFKVININQDITPEEKGRNGYSPKTGFQSPTDDHVDHEIDWNKILKGRANHWLKIEGVSMVEANILPGDILFYDRSITPVNGSIVFVTLENQFTVRYFYQQGNRIFLKPANPKYKTIEVFSGTNYILEGVITYILYKAQCRTP